MLQKLFKRHVSVSYVVSLIQGFRGEIILTRNNQFCVKCSGNKVALIIILYFKMFTSSRGMTTTKNFTAQIKM